jgi:putative transcriptional regulator
MNKTKKKAASPAGYASRIPKPKGTPAGRRLVESLHEVAAFMDGDKSAGRVLFPKPPVIDVAAVRAKTGLSQTEFARKFMLAPGTLRNWEQGLRQPEGATRLLLAVIDKAPEVVSRVAEDLAGITSL